MKHIIVILLGLLGLTPSHSFAGTLDGFVGTYNLQQGTDAINSNGDLVCPNPLILTLSLDALDSNMPQLPLLQIASLIEGNTHYTGEISADGSTFNYKQVTKSGCFLGLFCSTDQMEGSLSLTESTLVLSHSESSSSKGTQSSGTCVYTQ